jgi:predicted Fe-Mo cluster-binding NifX family protein
MWAANAGARNGKENETEMKVAIASDDGASISQHFGRSAVWLIFDVEDGKIAGKQIRPNSHSHHATHGCDGRDQAAGEHSHNEGRHSHAGLISALHDCEVILCAGMGFRAAQDLKRNGIEPFVVGRDKTPEEAVAMYLRGELNSDAQSFCCGRHRH